MILLLVRLLVRSSSIEFLRVEWPAVRDAPSLITTLTLPPLCLRGLYASNDREQNRSVDRAALRERAFLPFGFASGRVSDYIINRGWFLSLWQRIIRKETFRKEADYERSKGSSSSSFFLFLVSLCEFEFDIENEIKILRLENLMRRWKEFNIRENDIFVVEEFKLKIDDKLTRWFNYF